MIVGRLYDFVLIPLLAAIALATVFASDATSPIDKQGNSGPAATVPAGPREAKQDSAAPASNHPAADALGDLLPEGARLRMGTLRFRPPTPVIELALSPDEKTVVTIGTDALMVWDAETGKVRWRANPREHGIRLPGAAYGIRAVAFAADSARFYTPGGGNEVVVWNVASGRPEGLSFQEAQSDTPANQPAMAGSGGSKAVDITADGKKLAIGSSKGVVVCDAKGKARFSIANEPAAAVDPKLMNTDRLTFGGDYAFGRFSADGKKLAVVTSDAPKEIRVCDAENGKVLRRIALKAWLVRLAFSPDGKRIVTTERDVAVRLYATDSGERVWSRDIPPAKNAESYTSAVACSPDGKTIAACAPIGPDESIYLLDAATGSVLGKLAGHAWKPWALAFTADSRMLYSSGWDGAIRRWDVAARKQLPPPQGVRATGVCAAAPDGKTLAYADDLRTIHFVDPNSGADLRTLDSSEMGPSQLAFSPDSRQLAAGGAHGDQVEIVLRAVSDGKVLQRWIWPKGRDPHSEVESLAFTPDGNRLAAAVFRQSAAYLWDIPSGRRIARLPHQEIYGLSFSPDGKTLATAGWDKIVRFWESDTGKLREQFRVERAAGGQDSDDGRRDSRMYTVCYAPKGGLVATAHMDGTVRVWQSDKMTLRQSFQLEGRFTYGAMSFSPDGLWLATGAANGKVSVWDASTAQLVKDAGAHQSHVNTVGFGRDSRTLLTGGDDGVCYLWDLQPRQGVSANVHEGRRGTP